MTDFIELARHCEEATGPDRELDADICIAIGYAGANSAGAENIRLDPDWEGDLLFELNGEDCCNPIPPLTASLDAAMTLVPEGWSVKLYLHPGEHYAEVYRLGDVIETAKGITRPFAPGGAPQEGGPSVSGPLALTAAALRARSLAEQGGVL